MAVQPTKDNIELLIQDMNQRLENIKYKYNLFFSGEIRIPPEKEREELEKRIRNLMSSSSKSARTQLLIQNLSSRFSLYNNMWLKRLKELETGISTIPRKRQVQFEQIKPPPPKKTEKPVSVNVSLNREDSFEKFFDNYSKMITPKAKAALNKDQVINSIKTKLITANLVDAKVNLAIEKGKIKIKIKPS